MKKELLMVLILLLFVSCMFNSKASEPIDNVDIGFIIIECPNEVNVGQTIMVKAVIYDTNNNRITNKKLLCPNWLVDDSTMVKVKKIDADCLIIMAKKEGIINIKAIYKNTVSTARIIVQK